MRPVFYQRRIRPYNGFNSKFFIRLFLLMAAVLLGNAIWKFGEKEIARRESIGQTMEAERLLGMGRKIEAEIKLRAALGLDPRNIPANRLTARLLDEKGDPRALDFYRFVVLDDTILPGELAEMNFSSSGSAFFSEGGDYSANGDRFLLDGKGIALGPNASLEDAEALARAGVSYGNHRVARLVANSVGQTWNKPEFPHLINALVLERSGDFLAAEQELRTALARRETPQTLNALANFLLKRNDNISGRTSEAGTLLERLATAHPGDEALAALHKLITLRLAQPERLPALISRYRDLSKGDEAGLRFADEIELEYLPARREQILEAAVSRSVATPLPSKMKLARWLLDRNDPVRASRALPLKEAYADAGAFEIAIEALHELKDWQGADMALASKANPLQPHQTAALRSMGASLGGNPRANEMWSEIFDRHRGDPAIGLYLLQKSAAGGQWDVVLERLPSHFNDPGWAFKTFEKILPLARSLNDSDVLLKIHILALNSRMLGGDPVLRNRAAFDRLVAGVPVSGDELAERAKNFPENSSMRVTRALGFLRDGSKSRALYELEEVEPHIDPEKLEPRERAAFAAVLALNGRPHEAARIASLIPQGSLSPTETVFLNEYLKTTAGLH
jgi:hypothetical protein